MSFTIASISYRKFPLLNVSSLECKAPPPQPGASTVGWTNNGYYGCLTLSDEEMNQAWKYSSNVPACSYVAHKDDNSGKPNAGAGPNDSSGPSGSVSNGKSSSGGG